MLASSLLEGFGGADFEVGGISDDSREIGQNFIYFAIAGAKNNGATFINDAFAKGAAAVVAEGINGDKIFTVSDVRSALAGACARFYQPRPRHLAAVTGTDGKTSVAHFTRQMWEICDHKAASIGTIGVRGKNVPVTMATDSLANTTPGMVAISRLLQKLAESDVQHIVMETSSHGLDQKRIDGFEFAAAAFTNLTRDHLDYHGTVEKYFAAKARLFSEVISKDGVAVLNRDDAKFDELEKICQSRGIKIISFGASDGAELRLKSYHPHGMGADVMLDCFGTSKEIKLHLLGRFQIMNILASVGLVHATGVNIDDALASIPKLEGVPGRLENACVNTAGAPVLVDYAHTPAALENMLRAVREHVSGRLIVVFGCGGDRDAGKRPLMGKAASDMADFVIVTDDNPRSENPADIRQAVLAGVSGKPCFEIGDRHAAITTAVNEAKSGDVVVIAGKGHEKEQIIGSNKIPFDDVAVAKASVKGRQTA